jgi:hypothetical protein
MTNSEDLARKVSNLADKELRPTRRETEDKCPHAEGGGSRRLENQRRAKEATNWAEMGPGRSAQAGWLPFDLDASWAIYSPLTESHASINSSSTAEE